MMRNFLHLSILSTSALGLFACGEQEQAKSETETVQCELSLDELAGSEWLFLQELNGQDPKPDAKSRLKFVEDRWNVGCKIYRGFPFRRVRLHMLQK